MRRTGPTNYVWRKTIRVLIKASKDNNAPIWRYVAELLSRPSRRRVVVNLSKINRYSKEGDIIVVPGKVLGCGELNHRVTIGAMAFSMQAVEKIKKAGGRIMHILELVKENPKGSRVKIII
ncbi:LSU ribosomal protein L18AE [Ignisphaera aggregans DSM 17230]|uniref:Large ribosomal subunit protein eL18 n=1 Tax=Ignisphaera aggregans (strain DSM 17230 / JCM 13409 / AQ1.S1) TaxID=583356 RepID=E0SQ93_IGNAA|nr:LSU ribosomal protein L18AE [Ignisphaera aggregans DSM 17230]